MLARTNDNEKQGGDRRVEPDAYQDTVNDQMISALIICGSAYPGDMLIPVCRNGCEGQSEFS
jgi:hypothetical protein